MRERPLGALFLDLNSYFASVEQQEDPNLQGKPVAVAPLYADTTMVIAASYEAKAFGVKCGTMVRDARRMCPDITIVSGRPPLYVSYHKRVLEVLEDVLHIEEVHSIDEMRFKLMGDERVPENARRIALKMKKAIADHVGPCLTSSIGIAPNPFLAKVATEIEKPNGLVTLTAKDLPHALYGLKLTDFAGLNYRMKARLNGCGIFTSKDLCGAQRHELHRAFGSIIGERWWYLLRGFDLPYAATRRKSLGHSHILPPELRTEDGCRDVLLRLLQKASARLRSEGLRTSSMTVFVSGFKRSWECRIKLPPTQDTITLTEWFYKEWPNHDYEQPRGVGVTFHDLRLQDEFTPSLFDNLADRTLLNRAVDKVNQKFGKNSIYLASLDKVKDRAGEKIAFNKTWLFQEGKDDNVWPTPTRWMP